MGGAAAPRRSIRRARIAIAGATAIALAATTSVTVLDDAPGAEAAVDGDGFVPLRSPRRLLDTRENGSTWDSAQVGGGPVEGGTFRRLPVAGRAGVPLAADAVALNIAAIEPDADGFVTAYACDGERPTTSNLNFRAGEVASSMSVVPLAADGSVCLYARNTADLAVDVAAAFTGSAFDPLSAAERMLDTRSGQSTVDGRYVGDGLVQDGETVRIDVAGRGSVPAEPGPLLISIAAVTAQTGFVTVWGCGGARPPTSNLNTTAGLTVNNAAVVEVGDGGELCLFVRGGAHLVVDVVGDFDPATIGVLPVAARLLDTRPELPSVDGLVDNTGLRQGTATLRVPVAGRGGVPADAAGVVVHVVSVTPRDRGFVTAHTPAVGTPVASNLNHPAERNVGNLAIVPLDRRGEMCVFNRATTHLVVDVVAYFPGPALAPIGDGCPGQELFPHWRMVALYGTDSASVLGVLGEQPPDEAAARLEAIAEPWRAASDRPILPTFELIATIALASPGPSGLYRSRSSPERIQRYLDAARRHGVYLLLDLQPGRSDFLTEARAYEEFLREPDVGLALDPEWRTEAPARPGGGFVGQVDASEVNAVADWLAEIVAEEDLPEKLLVVHQFQNRMITNKDQLRQPDGIALNIHMDGFGTRTQKLETYRQVSVDPPWSNGFKLFFDEDINIFGAADVLGGTVDPVPDLISYQ